MWEQWDCCNTTLLFLLKGNPGNSVMCQTKGTEIWLLKAILNDSGMRCYRPFLYALVSHCSRDLGHNWEGSSRCVPHFVRVQAELQPPLTEWQPLHRQQWYFRKVISTPRMKSESPNSSKDGPLGIYISCSEEMLPVSESNLHLEAALGLTEEIDSQQSCG